MTFGWLVENYEAINLMQFHLYVIVSLRHNYVNHNFWFYRKFLFIKKCRLPILVLVTTSCRI